MPYDLEFHFTGMLLFDFRTVDGVEEGVALLANATRPHPDSAVLGDDAPHEHIPRLSVPAQNLSALGGGRQREPDAKIPDPAGNDFAVFDLVGEELYLDGDGLREPNRDPIGVCSEDPPKNLTSFNWLGKLTTIEPRLGDLRPECYSSLTGPVTSRFHFRRGILESRDVGRTRDGQPYCIEFHTLDDGPMKLDVRPYSNLAVLRLKNLARSVRLETTRGVIGIGPASPGDCSTVHVCVSNLAPRYHIRNGKLYELLWLYELFTWKNGPLKPDFADLPLPCIQAHGESNHTLSTGLCPPFEK